MTTAEPVRPVSDPRNPSHDPPSLPSWRQSDYHIHTYHSECGDPEMRPAAIVSRAESLGLTAIALTDHLEEPHHRDYFPILRSELAEIDTSISITFGCEITVYPPREITTDAEFAAQFGYVLCGYNHLHNPLQVDYFSQLPARQHKQAVLEMFQTAVDCPFVDAIAHPFFVYVGSVIDPDTYERVTEEEMAPILEAAARHDIAFEISDKAISRRAPGAKRLYRLAADAGLSFVVGSDAHILSKIGQTGRLEEFIQELGLDESRFIRPAPNVSPAAVGKADG